MQLRRDSLLILSALCALAASEMANNAALPLPQMLLRTEPTLCSNAGSDNIKARFELAGEVFTLQLTRAELFAESYKTSLTLRGRAAGHENRPDACFFQGKVETDPRSFVAVTGYATASSLALEGLIYAIGRSLQISPFDSNSMTDQQSGCSSVYSVEFSIGSNAYLGMAPHWIRNVGSSLSRPLVSGIQYWQSSQGPAQSSARPEAAEKRSSLLHQFDSSDRPSNPLLRQIQLESYFARNEAQQQTIEVLIVNDHRRYLVSLNSSNFLICRPSCLHRT
jgi:hypothetical protein